jgi:hypothetical protein
MILNTVGRPEKFRPDALIQDRSLDQTMDAIGDFLKVETAAA